MSAVKTGQSYFYVLQLVSHVDGRTENSVVEVATQKSVLKEKFLTLICGNTVFL